MPAVTLDPDDAADAVAVPDDVPDVVVPAPGTPTSGASRLGALRLGALRSGEPLFARHARLWLRIWLGTQLAATGLGTAVLASRVPSAPALAAALARGSLGLLLVALVAVHVAGARAHGWLRARVGARVLFVALCWGLAYAVAARDNAYALLLFGAVLQGFVFLPFVWAAAVLAGFVLVVLAAVAGSPGVRGGQMISAVGALGLIGTTIGTVVLYLHRANRDAAAREALVRQLRTAQARLAAQARAAGVLEERQRLARDLHDTLAQGFASIIAQLAAAELTLPPATARDASRYGRDAGAAAVAPQVTRHLTQAQAIARTSLAEIRRLMWALRPTPLADAPLAPALTRVVREWGAQHGVRAEVRAVTVPPLDPDAEVLLLRATQEALSNVARHAAASCVTVTLSHVDDLVLLEVDDDGVGIGLADGASETAVDGTPARGLGLVGMRERARRFGGYVLVDAGASGGTSVTVALPLATAAMPAAGPSAFIPSATPSTAREA